MLPLRSQQRRQAPGLKQHCLETDCTCSINVLLAVVDEQALAGISSDHAEQRQESLGVGLANADVAGDAPRIDEFCQSEVIALKGGLLAHIV